MPEYQDSIMETNIRTLIGENESILSPSPDGVGLKAHIGELFSSKNEDGTVDRLFIQFYATSRIPTTPADLNLGFVIDDIIFEEGVVVADVASRTDPPTYVGEVISEEQFLADFVVDPRLIIKIEALFEELRDMARPKENWLTRVSSLYNDRPLGNHGLAPLRKVC